MSRKDEIMARLRAIDVELRSESADTNTLNNEVGNLRAELERIELRNRLFDGIVEDAAGVISNAQPIERRDTERDTYTANQVIGTPEYRSAWLHHLQGVPLTQVEQRAMSTAAGSAGAAVPETTMNRILELLEQQTALYPLISKSNIPGTLRLPVEKASTAAAWHAENAAISATDPVLAPVTFAGFELVRLVTVSMAARKMTINAFEDFIIRQMARKLAIAIEAAITSGTGTNQPTGILTGVTFGATNSVTYTGTPTYDNIMDALKLLPSGYHSGAIFCCSTKTKYGQLRKIKDSTGRPFYEDNMIDGKQVVVNDQVPDDTIILFNPAYYHMNTQQEIQIDISDQSGFRNAQIDYRGYALMDGKPLLSEAYVKISK